MWLLRLGLGRPGSRCFSVLAPDFLVGNVDVHRTLVHSDLWVARLRFAYVGYVVGCCTTYGVLTGAGQLVSYAS
jgi:hypothetical protein